MLPQGDVTKDDHTDGPDAQLWLRTAPDIHSTTILRFGPVQIAVVQWIDETGITRMSRASRTIDHQLVLLPDQLQRIPKVLRHMLLHLVRLLTNYYSSLLPIC